MNQSRRVIAVKQDDLRRALGSGADGIECFIRDAEKNLTAEKRQDLICYLSATPFSSVKHEILSSDDDKMIKSLLIGLVFGQIDIYVAKERSIMAEYLSDFNIVCQKFGLSEAFIVPITRDIDVICGFFGESSSK